MILADTSVWIDHLRHGDVALVDFLERGLILSHDFVIGELALGNLGQRDVVIGNLCNLARLPVAGDIDVRDLIDRWALFGRRIGYVDAHLLASASAASGILIWTRDRRLRAVAEELSLSESTP